MSPNSLRERIRIWLDRYAQKSYSQDGEDLILKRVFHGQAEGFYVDVGAHHPQRFSNTYALYLQGWRGINIDALPGSMRLFDRYRSRDINLELGISGTDGELTYYMFNEPALNGFSKHMTETRQSQEYFSIGEKKIRTRPLGAVLKEHVPAGQAIDLLTVDVEGLDFEVLQSNDWETHRPRVVISEMLNLTLEQVAPDPIYQFLNQKNYVAFAKTTNSVFFRDRTSRP